MYTDGILTDLLRAFDTTDRDIKLQKLYHYGFKSFRSVSNEWFTSYLSNRKHMVSYNLTLSSSE